MPHFFTRKTFMTGGAACRHTKKALRQSSSGLEPGSSVMRFRYAPHLAAFS